MGGNTDKFKYKERKIEAVVSNCCQNVKCGNFALLF